MKKRSPITIIDPDYKNGKPIVWNPYDDYDKSGYSDYENWLMDRMMIYGEVPPVLNLKNVNNYIISC